MPLCRFPVRSLLRSQRLVFSLHAPQCRRRWLEVPRGYRTAVEGNRKDEASSESELDLSNVSGDSDYLDFLLGPRPYKTGQHPAEDVSDLHVPTASENKPPKPQRRAAEREKIETPMQQSGPARGEKRHSPLKTKQKSLGDGASGAAQTDSSTAEQSGPTRRESRVHPMETKQKILVEGASRPPRGALSTAKRSSNQPDRAPIARPRADGRADEAPHNRRKVIGSSAEKRAYLSVRINTPTGVKWSFGLPRRHLNVKRSASIATARSANTNLRFARSLGAVISSKWISVKSAGRLTDGFSTVWNQEFSKLHRYYHKNLVHDYLQRRTPPTLMPKAELWATTALDSIEKGKHWHMVPSHNLRARRRYLNYWQQAALWLLYNKPEKMVSFLRGTHHSPLPPSSYVQDSLQYLANHFSHCDEVSKKKHLSDLADLFPLLAHRDSGERMRMDDDFCHRLMGSCSAEQVKELYRAIKENHVKVKWHTLLHFATFFARNGHFEQSLHALLESRHAGAALDSFAFRSNCATLLRSAMRQPAGLRVSLRIVDNLVSIGVTLNNQLCNIVMLNAVEAGDLKTAFAIYNSLVDHGLEADKYTYAILLKGCKASIDDAEMLNTTIRSAIEHIDVLQSPVVATEILHCLALHHVKHNADRAFETVADAYAQLFDLEPLRKLGLLLPKFSQPSRPVEQRMPPPPHAIIIMLATYLEHVFRQRQITAPIHELYQRFRSLVDAGVEPFAPMIATDHISNVFLTFFIKTRKGLLYAAEVIKNMQRPDEPNAKLTRCKPTCQSWSIFLHGFTRHGQMKMAEQVLDYMRNKGLEPSQVTWNTLIAGYSGKQDVEGTLDSLRRMELDGATWDDWTAGGLRRLQDQQRLVAAYERSKRTPQLDFTAELVERIGEKISVHDPQPGVEERRVKDRTDGTADSPAELAEADSHGNVTYSPMAS